MGAISAGTEEDAGSQYPIQMEDSNGNQIFIRYKTGAGVTWSNSSARIEEVEDVRAKNGGSTYRTYSFTYNTDTPVAHLTNITSYIAGVGNWSFTYLSQTLNSPFTQSVSYGTTGLLSTANRDNDSMPAYQFSYVTNGPGELTQFT